MLYLIIGGAASGKSALGERYASRLESPLIYVATMEPCGTEGQARVKKHQEQRKGYGFDTVECYRDLDTLRLKNKSGVVLLECIGNLVANEMFRENMVMSADDTTSKVVNGIMAVYQQVKHLIMITNHVFGDGQGYTQETMDYIEALGKINRELAEKADAVIEAVCGLPIVLKGETYLP